MIETDESVETRVYPSSIVEAVWTTFYELRYYYQKTFADLFPDQELPFPESAITSFHNYEDAAKRYAETLEILQEITKEEPNPAVWETVEQRFPQSSAAGQSKSVESMTPIDDPNRRVPVNIFRLTVSQMVKLSTTVANANELIIYESLKDNENFKMNTENTTKRNGAKSAGSLYRWRVNFPHCNNVYYKDIREDPEHAFIYNPNQKNYKSAHGLSTGGFIFFPNPFDAKKLKVNSSIKPQLAKAIDLDNAADMVTEGVDYSRAVAPSGSGTGVL